MRREFAIWDEFIGRKGLRRTPQREKILEVFLSTERHVTAEELHKLVKKRLEGIGYVTVYRTMRILVEAGLCDEIDFGDGLTRFEHKYGHEHHDHLICMKCGRFIEVIDPKIERLQEKMAKERGFTPMAHKLEIFGYCRRCLKK
jgi:Fur family ferric uptake transcriptional regulator